MATSETVNDSQPDNYFETRSERLELEKQALRAGEEQDSMRHAIARMLCVGRNVTQSEGNDMTAERALLRFASLTAKAVGIALTSRQAPEDPHDVVLCDEEAGMVLIGLSEILSAGPELIDTLDSAGIDIRSDCGSRLKASEVRS
jgi:hypothetical protein